MSSSNTTVVKNGIGVGVVMAMIISWSLNHSVLWMLIHAFFSWFYVIYYLLFLK